MKIWHQRLIRHLPLNVLLRQHMDCCIYRQTENPDMRITAYHLLILNELARRGLRIGLEWNCHNYRGDALGYADPDDVAFRKIYLPAFERGIMLFEDHDTDKMLADLSELKDEELVDASVEELTLVTEATRT